jgi:hypothetical protein
MNTLLGLIKNEHKITHNPPTSINMTVSYKYIFLYHLGVVSVACFRFKST